MQVQTAQGLIDRALLDVVDLVSEDDNSRAIATEWRIRSTGELVRRDVHVMVLRTQAIGGSQATM